MKKLKFLLAATFFAAIFSTTARAQAPLAADTEADPYKREIGFGTNILLDNIFGGSSSPLDFMYKWKSGNGYLRVGPSIGYAKNTSSVKDQKSPTPEDENSSNSFSASLLLGKEWRADIAKKWLVNYGADLSLSNSSTSSNRTFFQSNQKIERMNEDESYGVGIRPFVGLIFKINQQLYLGTEASFLGLVQKNNTYLKETFSNRISSEIDLSRSLENETSGWRYSAATRPASNIFIYYRF